jgi:hypothetical protein
VSSGPVQVDIVSVAGLPSPKRDAGWLFTTAGPVVIAAFGLIVAFVALVYQHEANSAAQSSATRAEASLVSIVQVHGGATFDIDDLGPTPIYSVWLYPVPRDPRSVGMLPPCSVSSVVLTPASKPSIYFKDANGVSWERTISGTLRQAVNPSSAFSLLPLSTESALSASLAVNTTKTSGC